MKVYEFVDDRGERVISDWGLQKAQLGRLDIKLDLMIKAEIDPKTRKASLPPQLLVGPGYDGQQFIYKLKVKGDVQLRPMVCHGPFGDEWTILFRAVERDGILIPDDAAARAEACRLILAANKFRRKLLRDDK